MDDEHCDARAGLGNCSKYWPRPEIQLARERVGCLLLENRVARDQAAFFRSDHWRPGQTAFVPSRVQANESRGIPPPLESPSALFSRSRLRSNFTCLMYVNALATLSALGHFPES